MSAPWPFDPNKLHDLSWLRDPYFNELREVVAEAVSGLRFSDWAKIREAAVEAIADLAAQHSREYQRNREGGDICVYRHGRPIFCLRIGAYSRHRVEDLLHGKATYRGILSLGASGEVLYLALPTIIAGKWKVRQAYDMLDMFEWIAKHPGFSAYALQHALHFSPKKTLELLSLLKKQRAIVRRGWGPNTGWRLSRG